MAETPSLPDILTLDPATIANAVLRRLIAEVQAEAHDPQREQPRGAYDRTHNRHNRGPGPRPVPRPPKPEETP